MTNSNARPVRWLSDEEVFPGAHDDNAVTVRLVRPPAGPTYIVAIRAALPWVIRRRHLVPQDLE